MLKSEETSNNEEEQPDNLITMSQEHMLTFTDDNNSNGFKLSTLEAHEALNVPYDILEGQALQYFSGYIYKALMRLHKGQSCEKCNRYAGQITENTTEVKEHEIFTLLKRFEEEKCTLFSPTEEFAAYVGKAARILGFCFNKYLGSDKIKASLCNAVLEHVEQPLFCSDEIGEKLVEHIVRTLFLNKLKRINDGLRESGRNSTQSRRKLQILTHQ